MGVRGLEVCGLADVVRDPCGWYCLASCCCCLPLSLSLPCWVVLLVLPLLWVVLPAYHLLLLPPPPLELAFWGERGWGMGTTVGKIGIFITVLRVQ